MVQIMKYATITLAILATSSAFAQNLFSLSLSPTATDVSNFSIILSVPIPDANIAVPVSFPDFTAPVGSTTRFDFETDLSLDAFEYGFLGTYGTDGITIGMDSATATAVIGRTWEQVFTNATFSEANVRNAIDTDDFEAQFLFAQYLTTVQVATGGTSRDLFAGVGEQVTLVNFSTATRNGVGQLAPVPEPASMVALGAGVLAMIRRRKAKA